MTDIIQDMSTWIDHKGDMEDCFHGDKIRCYAYTVTGGLCVRTNTVATYCETNRQVQINFIYLCLFQRKSRAIVIARPLPLLLLCKNFNVVHFQNVLRVSTPNLKYLPIMTRCSCKAWGMTLKAIFLELCPFLTKNLK